MNPCGEFMNASSVFVVHGRETPDDGDGDIQMSETTTGDVDITYVCEGVEHNLVLEDITTWNCQDPNVPPPLIAQPNNSNRYFQFVYGQTPAGAIMNNITGDVLIAGTNHANGSGGYVGPVLGPFPPPNPNTLSDVITIPATCQDGERFYVYLKYWNKCNPFSDENLNYVDDFFIIEVVDAPDPPIVTSPQVYCFGSVPTTITATKINPSYDLNWYSDAALNNFLYTGDDLTHGVSAVGTYHFYVTQSSGVDGCESLPAEIVMNIIPEIIGNTITAGQTICYNTIPTAFTGSLPSGGNGSYTYEWQRSTTSATAGFSTAPGANSGINYTPPAALTTTTWYRRAVTSGPCTNNSTAIQITVYGQLNAGAVGSPQTICYNTSSSTLTQSTAASGGTGTYTYQWQSSPNNSAWTDISGATSTTYSPGVLTVTTYFRRNVTSGSCGMVSTGSVMITVYPEMAPGTIGSPQGVCYNTAPATLTQSSAPSGGDGTYSYRWQFSTDNVTWTNVSTGGTSSTYTPGALTVNTYFRRRVTDGNCGYVYSNSVYITVYEAVTSGSIGSAQSVCNNTAPATLTELTAPTGGSGTYTYQWQVSANGSSWSNITGATNQTYSPGALTANRYYRRIVTGGTCGSATSASILISVYSALAPGTIGNDQSICYNTSPATLTQATAPSGGTGTYTFQWQISANNSTWVDLSGATSSSYSPGNLTVTRYYRRNVNSGTCGTASSPSLTIIVFPNLTAGTVGSAQTICYNTAPASSRSAYGSLRRFWNLFLSVAEQSE